MYLQLCFIGTLITVSNLIRIEKCLLCVNLLSRSFVKWNRPSNGPYIWYLCCCCFTDLYIVCVFYVTIHSIKSIMMPTSYSQNAQSCQFVDCHKVSSFTLLFLPLLPMKCRNFTTKSLINNICICVQHVETCIFVSNLVKYKCNTEASIYTNDLRVSFYFIMIKYHWLCVIIVVCNKIPVFIVRWFFKNEKWYAKWTWAYE